MPECKSDLFRDTWVRYLGYSNEVGESFRSVVPAKVVRASYGVAFAYVLADTADKSWKMFKDDGRPKAVLTQTGDVLIWQTLASIIIPGYTINRICAYTHGVLGKFRVPKSPRNGITIAIGLASIPIIIQPIDSAVTLLMNLTYRRWFG